MFEEIELLGKKIKIKNYNCSINKDIFQREKIKLNLYIKINDECNAQCLYCSNHNMKNNGKLDIEKLTFLLKELKKQDLINRISITGGEPMLNFELLNNVINSVFEVIPNAFLTINTNGFNLKNILNLDEIDKIEGVHISRHHYDDVKNNEIFGIKVAGYNDIKKVMEMLSNKRLIRLNCLLLKGNIDNIDEVNKYLEFASLLDVFRVGFVSLMKVSDYCKENFIDFNNVFNKDCINTNILRHYYDQNICECINGAYISDEGKIIEYYARMTKELNCDYARQLVYTSDNKLTLGFGKEIII